MMGGIKIDAVIQHRSNFPSCTQVPFLVLILTIVNASLKSFEPIFPYTHYIFFSYISTIKSLNDSVIGSIKESKTGIKHFIKGGNKIC